MVEATQPLALKQTIRIQAPKKALEVEADATRLEQVLQNLLANAIKYAPQSQHIEVNLRKVDDDAELQVRDYGPGVSKEDQAQLFSRFYQAKSRSNQSGLGLGLYIVRQLVTAHGGTIELQSPPGGGAAFVVRLPLVKPPSAKAK